MSDGKIIDFRKAAAEVVAKRQADEPMSGQVHIEPHFQQVWFFIDEALLVGGFNNEMGFVMDPVYARNIANLLLRAAREAEAQSPFLTGDDDDPTA